jgi:hypothetical protein
MAWRSSRKSTAMFTTHQQAAQRLPLNLSPTGAQENFFHRCSLLAPDAAPCQPQLFLAPRKPQLFSVPPCHDPTLLCPSSPEYCSTEPWCFQTLTSGQHEEVPPKEEGEGTVFNFSQPTIIFPI